MKRLQRHHIAILLVALVLTSILFLFNRSTHTLQSYNVNRLMSPLSAADNSASMINKAAMPMAASLPAAPAAAPAQAAMAGQPAAPSIQRRG